MKFKNEKDKLVSFHDEKRWYTFKPNEVKEIPKESVGRAKAHGLTEVKEKPAVVKKKSRRR